MVPGYIVAAEQSEFYKGWRMVPVKTENLAKFTPSLGISVSEMCVSESRFWGKIDGLAISKYAD